MQNIEHRGHTIVDGVLQLPDVRMMEDIDLSFCTALTMLPKGLRVVGSLNLEFVLP